MLLLLLRFFVCVWFLADNRSNWKNKNKKKLSDAFIIIIIIKIIFSVFWLLTNK